MALYKELFQPKAKNITLNSVLRKEYQITNFLKQQKMPFATSAWSCTRMDTVIAPFFV